MEEILSANKIGSEVVSDLYPIINMIVGLSSGQPNRLFMYDHPALFPLVSLIGHLNYYSIVSS